jgi:hypothetical protein
LNHTDAPASTVTSPTSTAVGATNAVGSTFGDRPSNEYIGIVQIYRSTPVAAALRESRAKL